MTALEWLGVLALGGLGAIGRFVLDGAISQRRGRAFPTWMLESHRLVEDGEWRAAAVNLGASLVIGLLAAAAGRAIGMAL